MTTPRIKKPINLETLMLKHGSHPSRKEGLCAMEAAAWIAGEKHSDHPVCVCPVIGAFMRSWNDGLPDDAERTRLLVPMLTKIVGTKATEQIEQQRAWMATDLSLIHI